MHDREKEVHTLGYSEEQISELKKEIHRTRDEQLAHITSMVRAYPIQKHIWNFKIYILNECFAKQHLFSCNQSCSGDAILPELS